MHEFTSEQLSLGLEFSFDNFIYLDTEGHVIGSSHNFSAIVSQKKIQQLFPGLTLQKLETMRISLHSIRELQKVPAIHVELNSELKQHLTGSGRIRVVCIASMAKTLPGYLICFEDEHYALSNSEHIQLQLENMKDQLLRSEKMAAIGQLAAGVAHEINNPIGYVSSNLQTLSEYCHQLIHLVEQLTEIIPAEQVQPILTEHDFNFVREDFHALVKESDEGIQRVIEIIHALKDFSHTGDEAFVLANIHGGIQTTLSIINNEVKYKAEVIQDLADLPDIECIPSQLNQVVMNLLVNASHAIESKGTITIRTKQEGQWVVLEIIDDGKGIEPAHMERLYEPFFTTKAVGQGTGLGLALTHSIVTKHQGKIEVDSEPGKGSCFRVWLPLRQT